jgi:hypothetical protein
MTGEFGKRLMDVWYTSNKQWTELHKTKTFFSFKEKPDSRSAPQQVSRLLRNSRLIRQQQYFRSFWYRGHFKSITNSEDPLPKIISNRGTLKHNTPYIF